MTNREQEFASLGFEYAEGIECAEVIIIPSTGRGIHKYTNEHGDNMWKVQPHGDNYWLHFDDLLAAIKCGTRPAGRPQRNPPAVEVRKPFVVVINHADIIETWGIVCQGCQPLFPNTHANTLLMIYSEESKAHELANRLNEAFISHFDV